MVDRPAAASVQLLPLSVERYTLRCALAYMTPARVGWPAHCRRGRRRDRHCSSDRGAAALPSTAHSNIVIGMRQRFHGLTAMQVGNYPCPAPHASHDLHSNAAGRIRFTAER